MYKKKILGELALKNKQTRNKQINIQSSKEAMNPSCLELQPVKSCAKYHNVRAQAVTRCSAVSIMKTDMGL